MVKLPFKTGINFLYLQNFTERKIHSHLLCIGPGTDGGGLVNGVLGIGYHPVGVEGDRVGDGDIGPIVS